MARTVGDTSKTHTSARFISIDTEAAEQSGPAHAGIYRRVLRNANWLEANTAYVQFSQVFPEAEVAVLDVDSEQINVQAQEWRCFGPWFIAPARRQLKLQFGFGVEAGAVVHYYAERLSEGRGGGWVPSSTDYEVVDNSAGSDTYVDGDELAIDVVPGVDWVRLWVRCVEAGVPGLTKGSTAGIIEAVHPSSPLDRPGDNYHYTSTFDLVCRDDVSPTGVYIDWHEPDFVPRWSKSVVIFDGVDPVNDNILMGPFPVWSAVNSALAGDLGLLTALRVKAPQTDTIYEAIDKAFQLRAQLLFSLRYVRAYEGRLTTVDSDDPTRSAFTGLNDEQANVGETGLRVLQNAIETNSEAINKQSQIVINEVLEIHADRTLRTRQRFDSSSTWTTMCEHGFFLEPDRANIVAQYTYVANGFMFDLELEARLRFVNETGTQIAVSAGVDFTPTQVSTDAEGRVNSWLGPWWQGALTAWGPVLTYDASALAGTFYGCQLQLQYKAGGSIASEISVAICSWHVWSTP